MSGSSTVRYRVVVGRGDVRVEGPQDAAVEITVPVEVASDPGFDPTVEFMRGRLKAAGHTGALFEALGSGEAAEVLSRLASHP